MSWISITGDVKGLTPHLIFAKVSIMHTPNGPHFAYSISYSDHEGHHVIGDTSRTAAGLIDRLGQAISRLLDRPAFHGVSMPGYTRVDASVRADSQPSVTLDDLDAAASAETAGEGS